MITAFTNFADEAVLLPVMVGAAAVLALFGWWRGTAAWLLGIGATLLLIGASKLLVFGCGGFLYAGGGSGLHSPSGHTGGATVVYGSLIALALRSWRGEGWTRGQAAAAALLCGAPLTLAFAVSRLILGLHTTSDVLAGGAIGLGGAVLVVVGAGAPPRRVRWLAIVLVCAVTALLLHGRHLQAEQFLHALDRHFWPDLACPGIKMGAG